MVGYIAIPEEWDALMHLWSQGKRGMGHLRKCGMLLSEEQGWKLGRKKPTAVHSTSPGVLVGLGVGSVLQRWQVAQLL